jgi:hypothetical protein
MQLSKATKIIINVTIVILIGINIYFVINRFDDVVKYEDEIDYVDNNTLSNFETEQNNFKKFQYARNPNAETLDYADYTSKLVTNGEEMEALVGKSDEIILDSSFIDKLPNLNEFKVKGLILPFKYSDYFDYTMYGASEPELNNGWNFNVLDATYDYFLLDIIYTNEYFILPGPLTKLELIENSIGYLKSKGIDPSKILLSVDARYYVWEDRYFEDNLVLNYIDKEVQADVVSKSEFTTKYPKIKALSGLTENLSNTENYEYIALSLDLDINELTNLAINLGLRGIMVRYG